MAVLFDRPKRLRANLLAAAACWFAMAASPVLAQTLLFFEDFENLPLGPSVDEFPTNPFPNAFTADPPPGWDRADDLPPFGQNALGVTEWRGWSFANEAFWKQAAQQPVGATPRDRFNPPGPTGNTIAVADPDQWNDLGDPANASNGGFYNTLIQTPFIDISEAEDPSIRLKLGFDTSWFGGDCCDDGQFFTQPEQPEPFSNNQTAFIQLRSDDGTVSQRFLEWEAAPFLDASGNPTSDFGPGVTPNPRFQPIIDNGRVWVDLEMPLPPAVGPGLALTGSASSSMGGLASLEFGMENAGDDGWWAVDNVEMITITTLPGDMNVNDVLDEGDIAAFALGLLDTTEYRNTYYGEFPVTRGSDDGTFDFDDIEWFVDIMEMGGVSTSPGAIMSLLTVAEVPEPATSLLLGFGVAAASSHRRRRPASP